MIEKITSNRIIYVFRRIAVEAAVSEIFAKYIFAVVIYLNNIL